MPFARAGREERRRRDGSTRREKSTRFAPKLEVTRWVDFSLRRDAPDTANDLTFHRLNENANGVQASFLDSLANFARWGRTLRVVN